MNVINPKITRLFIRPEDSILSALKKMDDVIAKLLIIIDNGKLIGLISIGDIQRAIIRNNPLTTPVIEVVRPNFYYAHINEDPEDVKKRMVEHRDECMPIVDEEGNIADVIFWDDIFPKHVHRDESTLDLPVVIMAGGKGTRMRPLTNVIPKPLIPLGEHTISEEIIRRFGEFGVKEFYMSLNYKAELVKFYFKDSNHNSFDLTFFEEDQPLGTAGSLHLLKDKLKTTFFVSNCDVIIDQDYREILQFHRSNHNLITMVCSLKTIYIPYGTVKAGEEGQLISMKEKPELNFMINTGMYVLEPELLQQIPCDRLFHITELISQTREKHGRIGVFPISEKQYYDTGEWEYYLNTIKTY
jgi:dTDP-glucose pyrophosphorylase